MVLTDEWNPEQSTLTTFSNKVQTRLFIKGQLLADAPPGAGGEAGGGTPACGRQGSICRCQPPDHLRCICGFLLQRLTWGCTENRTKAWDLRQPPSPGGQSPAHGPSPPPGSRVPLSHSPGPPLLCGKEWAGVCVGSLREAGGVHARYHMTARGSGRTQKAT